MLIGSVSGLVSIIPESLAKSMVVVAAVATLARDYGLVRFRLPQKERQVPQEIVRLGPGGASLQFGFELGTGMRTYLTAATPYAVAAAILLLGDPLIGMLAGGSFGVGRALMPLLRHASGDRRTWDRLLEQRLTQIVRGCALIGAVTVIFLIR